MKKMIIYNYNLKDLGNNNTFNNFYFIYIYYMLYHIDIDYGRINELIIFDKLKIFFKDHTLSELDYYNDFDYKNTDSTLLIELKSRRCEYETYTDTMINISKLNKCKRYSRNKKIKMEIYFFFYFNKNDLYYWKYNEVDTFRYGTCSRVDRENVAIKYAYISKDLLTKVE